MNIEYLNKLNEVANIYDAEITEDEKVVFTSKLKTFGTEKQQNLGIDAKLTMTNKNIFIDNGAVTFKINILDDIVDCRKEENKFLFIKNTYFRINLNKVVVLNEGKIKFNGYVLYFDKMATCQFEKIINNLFMH